MLAVVFYACQEGTGFIGVEEPVEGGGPGLAAAFSHGQSAACDTLYTYRVLSTSDPLNGPPNGGDETTFWETSNCTTGPYSFAWLDDTYCQEGDEACFTAHDASVGGCAQDPAVCSVDHSNVTLLSSWEAVGDTCQAANSTCQYVKINTSAACCNDAMCGGDSVCVFANGGANYCVECKDDDDCSGGEVCSSNECVAPSCSTHDDCSNPLPICDSGDYECRICLNSSECVATGDTIKILCSSGQCVCQTDPTCNGRACTSDAQCTNGTCGQGDCRRGTCMCGS